MSLSFCFKSNNWNIGAEGQLTFGGIIGGGVALLFYNQEGFYILPLVILAGAIGEYIRSHPRCFKHILIQMKFS